MKRTILTLILSLILLSIFATPVLAQEPGGAQVVFGDNLTVEGEQTLDQDVVVFGGNVEVDASSKITGDLVVFGGRADIDGTIEGDIGMIGGNINLGETAVVKGDIGLIGGRADVAEGAVVKGQVRRLNHFNFDYDSDWDNEKVIPDMPPIPTPPSVPDFPGSPDFPDSFEWPNPFHWISRVVGDIVRTMAFVVVLGLLSWLAAAFMPEQMLNVRQTVATSAPMSFGVGLITLVVVVAVGFLLLLTICLAFIPILAYILLGIAALFGWIVIGQIIGERLLVASGRSQPGFIFSSIFGVTVLTLLTKMPVIGEIPCIGFIFGLAGFLVGIILTMTGLGAVLLTRFGTRPYPAPTYPSYSGGSYPSSSFGTGVHWTDPAPEVAEDEMPASEAELKAKIKAALAEADKGKGTPDEETPADEEPDTDKPTPDTPDEPEPDDEPEQGPKRG